MVRYCQWVDNKIIVFMLKLTKYFIPVLLAFFISSCAVYKLENNKWDVFAYSDHENKEIIIIDAELYFNKKRTVITFNDNNGLSLYLLILEKGMFPNKSSQWGHGYLCVDLNSEEKYKVILIGNKLYIENLKERFVYVLN